MKHGMAVILVAAAACMGSVSGAIQFANSLTDHMVLSRSRPAVWGTLDDGSTDVSVSFAGHKVQSEITVVNGRWKAVLAAQPPTLSDDGFNLTVVTSAGSSATLQDVLMGRVIAASGQSNMQFTVSTAFNATAEIAASAGFPRVRVAELNQNMSVQQPLEDVASLEVGWARAGPDSVGGPSWHYLSAVAWYTAREVFARGEQPEPVGVIVFAWGGTVVEAWMSDAMLRACGEDPDTWVNPGKPAPNAYPGSLWNGMVHPLLNMSVDNFIWYQGEQNVELNGTAGAGNYSRCFPQMIRSWLAEWGARGAQFAPQPFVYVELAGWCEDADGANCSQPVNGPQRVAQLRWAQAANHTAVPNALSPHALRALAYDLADPLTKTDPPPYGDIHPRDKQDVGARLARVILGQPDSTAPYVAGCASGGAAALTVDFRSSTGTMWLNDQAFTSGFDWRGKDGVWREAHIAGVNGTSVTIEAPPGSSGCTGIRFAWRDDPCCPLTHYPDCPRMNCALYDRKPDQAAALDPRLPAAPFALDVDASGACVVP